ncbi:nuclear transport factor 2 family protein [Sphingobium nicotianae]|uniref:Nuclear transport factor 2 family protein n=1 Tax=Sphingobium nicotianae TaxID=2782607 RepID=A0A9X1DB35_9SPHN|nr:nuclear transport factor 2 family protein [Sphingobium nicotianae]MBT2186743.1 nuclear transport factor 2 family protein [Sphingobium nicotianae]
MRRGAMALKVPLEDRVEIEELMARYAWALDTGDFEGYAMCFTEDGWLEHWPQGRCHGREGLKRATDSLWYERPNHYLGRQHRMSQVLMNPDTAEDGTPGVRIKCFWSILQHDVVTFENRVFGMGTWDTLAVKDTDGEWRFKSVYVDLWINGQVPWQGEKRAWGEDARAAAAAE